MACAPLLVHAGLGQNESSIAQDSARLLARHSRKVQSSYTMHELLMADGSRIRQYVASDQRVFAISWLAMHKPDLTQLLGDAYSRYASAAQAAASQGGIQRNFHHESLDLVVHSSGHLHLFTGVAYRPSMVPSGFNVTATGLE
jgi:predicted heme/steroid binding protein